MLLDMDYMQVTLRGDVGGNPTPAAYSELPT